MRSTPSRLLTRLDASIASARSDLDADCLRAERACYLARQGLVDQSRHAITELRKKYFDYPDLRMSSWLNLAEGLESYFRNLGKGSRDKVLRAFVLSEAGSLTSVQAVSAAWLAQMDFTLLAVDSMAKHAKLALSLASVDDLSAAGRASLVIAQALHVGRRFDLALPWYRRAHWLATEAGDDVGISALMHNMACMRLDNMRQIKLLGLTEEDEMNVIRVSAESTNHLDQLIGASTLKPLSPLLYARIHSLEGRPSDALQLYQDHITADVHQDFARMKSDVLSDVAWCQVQLDKHALARQSALEAHSSLAKDTQVDDRAATHTRLSWVYRALGDEDSADQHQGEAAIEWAKFGSMQARVIELLGSFSDPEPNRIRGSAAR